jgi:hypothetical protein
VERRALAVVLAVVVTGCSSPSRTADSTLVRTYVDRAGSGVPQEALTTQVLDAAVAAIDKLRPAGSSRPAT